MWILDSTKSLVNYSPECEWVVIFVYDQSRFSYSCRRQGTDQCAVKWVAVSKLIARMFWYVCLKAVTSHICFSQVRKKNEQ